jgi:regulatory protein
MLARRELSEYQVRQRLRRHGYESGAIEEAVDRLLADRAIDDARVAEAIAHTEIAVRRRGRLRARRQIEQAGIAPATARRAIDAIFQLVDDEALLERAMSRRLRGREQPADDAEFQKLYRFLVGQGFEPERVLAALVKRKGPSSRP